jgi:hypothetical protein
MVGNRWELAQPGETLHFVDAHDPDKWSADAWSLTSESFEVATA